MSAGIAVNRFGLGARPGDLQRVAEPRAWLRDQLTVPIEQPAVERPRSAADVVRARLRYRRLDGKEGRKRFQKEARALLEREQAARWQLAMHTERPFAERWVRFWRNHLTVSTTRKQVVPVAGAFEREVIRGHALGSFEDLLLASCRHPAMLVYLDNVRSIGPNSRAARGRGLNENLAREVLELHTLGVRGGYAQSDVEALASLLTGWSVQRKEDFVGDDAFLFHKPTHEPGQKTLLGRTYAQGEQAGADALRDLARHPSTRAHLCTKIARHFVADDPPDRAVSALQKVWKNSDGDLKAVAHAVIELPSAWNARQRKLKSPTELLISMARGFGLTDKPQLWMRAATTLGQPTDGAPSPQGWPDNAADWLGGEAMLARLDVANTLALRTVKAVRDPATHAKQLLGDQLTEHTVDALRAAEGPRRGIALLAASPEFQRR